MVASSDPAMVHFITHIYVTDQDGEVVSMRSLDPSVMSTASITFAVPRNASSLTAYEFCNKHGLWRGPTMQIPQRNAIPKTTGGRQRTALSGCAMSKLRGVIALIAAMAAGQL